MGKLNLVGRRFGRLLVLSSSHKDKFGQTYWRCQCDCGNEIVTAGIRSTLRNGVRSGVKSCGCLRLGAHPMCNRGHARSEFGFKRRDGVLRCRACERINTRKRSKTVSLSRENLAIVLEGLAHGLTIGQMTECASRRSASRPCAGVRRRIKTQQIANFARQYPKLGNRMKALSYKNACKNRKLAAQSRRIVAAPALLHNNGLDAFEAITRATAGIWEDDRGDVQSLMFIALGEGKLKPSDCTPERAGEYLKIHRRRPNVLGSYSLDTPIGEDGTMTWLDTKTDEDRLWS